MSLGGIVDTFDPGYASRQALWESVVAVMRRAIILGELPPGLHLEEPALATKFGVSRIPIREALTRLAHEGLVRLEPRRGAFVVGITEEDIRDIYELRLLLETYAIRAAAERAKPGDLEPLRVYADRMSDAVREHQHDRIAGPDVNFHRHLVVLSGNQRLLAAWDPIGGLVETFLSITDTTHRDMPGSVASHYAMIRMLEQREADAVERELRKHLAHGEDVMRQAMQDAQAIVLASLDGGVK